MKRIITLIMFACCFVCHAKQYQITSLHGVTIICENKNMRLNDIIDTDKDILSIIWSDTENGYYILKDLSDGKSIVIRPTTLQTADSDLSLYQRLKRYLIGVKNCSSRAADEELQGGLANYMSQTFYLSFSDSALFAINIATDLLQDEDNFFSVSYRYNGEIIEHRLSVNSNFLLNILDFNSIKRDNNIIKLRCSVYYHTKVEQFLITESMNIIIFP